ncbi:MAG: hypothetical protein LR015_01330 [Verrucomicrobia bacterium]|nr:hypothetical protein [Verrucomicrobiota bacterium]
MNDFQPIPIPLKQRWRSFRTQWFPIVIFCSAAIAIFVLWEREVTPSSLSGEAVGLTAIITAPASGILQNHTIAPFQIVEQGQVIGWMHSLPPDQAEAALDVLRTEIELIQSGGGDPVLDQQRNFLSWQSLRRDLLLARTDVATLTVRAAEAGRDLERKRTLHAQGNIPAAELDRAESEFAILSADKENRQRLLDCLESRFALLRDNPLRAARGCSLPWI